MCWVEINITSNSNPLDDDGCWVEINVTSNSNPLNDDVCCVEINITSNSNPLDDMDVGLKLMSQVILMNWMTMCVGLKEYNISGSKVSLEFISNC